MIKYCKHCGKKIIANGKREFCSDKCRKAYNYAKKTGKVVTGDMQKPEIPDDIKPDRELTGTVVKVATTSGGKKLVQIEFDLFESSGISDFLKKPAKVLFYNYEQPKRYNHLYEKYIKPKKKDPTDDLFDDYDPYFD